MSKATIQRPSRAPRTSVGFCEAVGGASSAVEFVPDRLHSPEGEHVEYTVFVEVVVMDVVLTVVTVAVSVIVIEA